MGMSFENCVAAGVQTAARGLLLYLMSATVGVLLFSGMLTGISLLGSAFTGIVVIPLVAYKMRQFADLNRRLLGRWTGVPIERPYLPHPPREPGIAGLWNSTVRELSSRAMWRDLLWMGTDPFVGAFTALLPAALILNGLLGLLLASGLWIAYPHGGWYVFVQITGWEAAPAIGALGVVQFLLGIRYAGPLLRLHAEWCRVLLAPDEKTRLALRVQRLTETRSDAVDAQAAELRRIERDLHDGAQARLVAMGMSLGAIEHLLDKDPDKARLLLAEARQTSAKALGELRDLVRGIHPPVLADRGLVDAVRALALDHPMRVEVTTADVPERLEPSLESAAYFAVSELLTNVAKHADASRIWIDIRSAAGTLQIVVTDDGHGGAEASRGTGLRGIERRIGTFDGILALSSPPGGPTIVTMELPCALSSPRT